MKKFQYEEHTAEAKFTAFGHSLEEAFVNAALAMENMMLDTGKVKPKIKKQINIETKHLKSLLYDFLQEFIVLFDSEFFVLNKIDTLKVKQKGSDYILIAIVWGDNAHHYEVLSGIKAVTYHEMEIKEEKGYWKVVVVLDV